MGLLQQKMNEEQASQIDLAQKKEKSHKITFSFIKYCSTCIKIFFNQTINYLSRIKLLKSHFLLAGILILIIALKICFELKAIFNPQLPFDYGLTSTIIMSNNTILRSYKSFMELRQFSQKSIENPFLEIPALDHITYDEFVIMFKVIQIIKKTNNYIDTPILPTLHSEQKSHLLVNLTEYFVSVKNQHNCSSCYAFPITAAVQYLFKTEHKKAVSFSEQQIIDCAYNKNGCEKGNLRDSLNYVLRVGLLQEEDYEYKSFSRESYECRYSKLVSWSEVYKIGGYKKLTEGSCEAVREQLERKAPVISMMNLGELQEYKKGEVFRNCRRDEFNHAVLIVGVRENGNWIVRNSWGAAWGNNGYFELAAQNTCGICTHTYIVYSLI